MAEFATVVNEGKRMCLAMRDCVECALYKAPCDILQLSAQKDIREIEEKILAWSAANPLPPKPIYPNWATYLMESGIIGFDWSISENFLKLITTRIDAETAEKLGIQPLNGGDPA